MIKVDWSLAPEGATHYGYVSEKRICWYIVRDEDRYDYAYQNEGRNAEKWSTSCGSPGHSPLIERPTQPKPWSGPEDGLPPIGIECDFSNNRVKIIAHIDQPECLDDEYKKLAVGQQRDRGPIVFGPARNFSLAKTQEQIAADKRETAIREIMDVADVDCRVTAARLVDAGFKREVV